MKGYFHVYLIFWLVLMINLINATLEDYIKRDDLNVDNIHEFYNERFFNEIVNDLESENLEAKFYVFSTIKPSIFEFDEIVFNRFVDAGIIPALVKCCLNSTVPRLQVNAFLTLGSIVENSTNVINDLIQENVIPYLIQSTHSKNTNVALLSITTINLIIKKSPELRDYCLNLALIENISALIDSKAPKIVIRLGTWLFYIITRSHDEYPLSKAVVKKFIPQLGKLIRYEDSEILSNATLGLMFLIDEDTKIDKTIIKNVVKLLDNREHLVKYGALRILENLVTGKNFGTKVVLQANVIKYFPELLMHSKEFVVEKTLTLLMQIMSGFQIHTRYIFDAHLIPLVIFHLAHGDPDVQKEAVDVIYEAALKGSPEDIIQMVDLNIVWALCKYLKKDVAENSSDYVNTVLITFNNIISKSKCHKIEIFKELVKCNCLELISSLEIDSELETEVLAVAITDSYFPNQVSSKCFKKGIIF